MRLGLHHRRIGDARHVIPLLHQRLGRVGQAEPGDRVFGDLPELHRRHLAHVVGRDLDAPFGEEIDVDLIPYAHGIQQRSVKIEDCRLAVVVVHDVPSAIAGYPVRTCALAVPRLCQRR